MAKMDEIMEVLTQEISGFNSSIKKLEGLSEELNNLKIEAGTSSLEFLLKGFLKTQEESMITYENRVGDVLKKIEKSRRTPKWEGVLLYIFLSFNTISFGYLGYYFISYDLKMQNAVSKAKQEGLGKARGYFQDHQVIYKDFERWAERQDSVPNQK